MCARNRTLDEEERADSDEEERADPDEEGRADPARRPPGPRGGSEVGQ